MKSSSTSQKNSLPLRLQNQLIQLATSSSEPLASSLDSPADILAGSFNVRLMRCEGMYGAKGKCKRRTGS